MTLDGVVLKKLTIRVLFIYYHNRPDFAYRSRCGSAKVPTHSRKRKRDQRPMTKGGGGTWVDFILHVRLFRRALKLGEVDEIDT